MARSCYISVITAYTADSIDRRNTIFVGHWVRPETDSALPHWDKHSAVLSLVQDEPALRAGAASGILDKTCARRSAGGVGSEEWSSWSHQGMQSGSWRSDQTDPNAACASSSQLPLQSVATTI